MAPTQSTQFSQVYVGDASGTLQELSAYLQSVSLPDTNADINVTTFAAGGGPVTDNHIRGAITDQVQVTLLFDTTTVLYTLMQICAARAGTLWRFLQGANTLPGFGDLCYQGTFTVFGISVTYNQGAPATLSVDLRPTDGGAVVPAWYPA